MSENEEEGVTFEVEEAELQVDGKKVTRKGVYLLPNLFTTAGLFAGFYAIIAAMNGQFEKAAIAITVAANLDVLDGAVARLTKTQSEFGAQYDSLHDLVSFGLAPAILIYAWGLVGWGKLGWMVAFIYVACAALRLARFNSQNQNEDKEFFTGLGSPASALLVVGFVWTCVEYQFFPEGLLVSVLALLVCLWAGLLMISNFKFSSPKQIDLQGRVPFVVILAPIFCLAIFFINPPVVMLIVATTYSFSGPLITFFFRNS
jgi:CDP-diacylglycerol--serine O-phosphatidyltransferase